MKIAISIPDLLFERVEEQIADSGPSRSAFFAAAAEEYLSQLDALDVTKRIDAVLEGGDVDPGDRIFVEYNTTRLAAETW